MAKRGRKPAPTALKKLAGVRADRINGGEPPMAAGRPECPDHLDDDAREEWERIVPLLDEAGILARADGAALAIYCTTFSRWLRAKAELKYGLTVMTEKGGQKASPLISVVNQAEALMARLLAEFGATPSARSTLRLPEKPPVDELSAFLGTG